MDRFQQALNGKRGDDQQRIANTGLEFIDIILRKNKDYGSSVWKTPVLTPGLPVSSAILVRMSDKIERVINLTRKDSEVKESLEDTLFDLGAYALLYLAQPKEEEEEEEE